MSWLSGDDLLVLVLGWRLRKHHALHCQGQYHGGDVDDDDDDDDDGKSRDEDD